MFLPSLIASLCLLLPHGTVSYQTTCLLFSDPQCVRGISHNFPIAVGVIDDDRGAMQHHPYLADEGDPVPVCADTSICCIEWTKSQLAIERTKSLCAIDMLVHRRYASGIVPTPLQFRTYRFPSLLLNIFIFILPWLISSDATQRASIPFPQRCGYTALLSRPFACRSTRPQSWPCFSQLYLRRQIIANSSSRPVSICSIICDSGFPSITAVNSPLRSTILFISCKTHIRTLVILFR
jgi:hypothetical protein